MKIIQLIIYLLKKLITPIILVLVWFYNIRPITILDKILPIDLMKKIKDNPDIPPTIIGAIDVAFLTVIFAVLSDLFNKLFSKPIDITVKIKPKNSSADSVTIKSNEDKIEDAQLTVISFKFDGEIHKFYKTIKFIFRGIKVKIFWHPEFITVRSDLEDITWLNPSKGAGTLSFDALKLFSESDSIVSYPVELRVGPNNPYKDHGKIAAKIEVSSEKKWVCACFSGILNSLINLKIEPCNIHIEKGS
ncbi:hypothetical protein ACLZHR_09510 [Priestia aryabhattai]|uniref:hypothetical protein n=1 Tax=Priestia aryabhattai TaxID=412384 RepID=UPI003A7F8AFC